MDRGPQGHAQRHRRLGPVETAEWRKAWADQSAAPPKFRESRLWLVSGVLPHLEEAPETDVRVYRLTADDGTHLIARVVPASLIDVIRMKLGLDRRPARQISPRERMEELMARRCEYLLDQDLVLSRRRHWA